MISECPERGIFIWGVLALAPNRGFLVKFKQKSVGRIYTDKGNRSVLWSFQYFVRF